MQLKTETVDEYIQMIPENQRESVARLREEILKNIPPGFSEEMSYGMIGYVVPHSLYPKGYHANPKLPLPFLNVAAQKNFIAVYHIGLYASSGLLQWFIDEYAKYSGKKPDMGKGCIRFKNYTEIPFSLIGELASKLEVSQWITHYELNREAKK
ncbi:MAG: DUF1801 domain-containing protein [Prolixibacteraceae bacterium]|jgi:uncharacterized protein YdhG (YjbR/CyaY superfamily)